MSFYTNMRGIFLIFIYFATVFSSSIEAKTAFESQQLKLRIKARTPHQMAAFYEARGFPAAMIKKLNDVCFFTISIKNRTHGILWHDLSSWNFISAGKNIQRFDREYWKSTWQNMQIPMASQSTFRWTLMPEYLDFRPQESEGGNITLPRGPLNYNIEAVFKTGADQTGPLIKVKLTDIRCTDDEVTPKP